MQALGQQRGRHQAEQRHPAPGAACSEGEPELHHQLQHPRHHVGGEGGGYGGGGAGQQRGEDEGQAAERQLAVGEVRRRAEQLENELVMTVTSVFALGTVWPKTGTGSSGSPE